jgi:hypothetical protein
MKNLGATWCVAMLASGLLTAAASAQVPGGYRPAVSPYLNLRLTGDPALNYYGLVRPQVVANKTFQALGNDINNLEAANSSNQLVQTGHASSFMTQGRYFMNNGASYRAAGTQGTGAGMQMQNQMQAQPQNRR